jgi:hypothetical protein
MKFRIFVLFFLIFTLFSNAYAEDKFSLHLACSQKQPCIDLAGGNGVKESVEAVPVMEFSKADIKAAGIQKIDGGRLALNIELSEEASKKFEILTRENIGKKLIVAFNNKILIAPLVQAPISEGKMIIGNYYGGKSAYWENSSWLQDLIRASHRADQNSVRLYSIATLAIILVTVVFVLLPRFRQARTKDSE